MLNKVLVHELCDLDDLRPVCRAVQRLEYITNSSVWEEEKNG